MKICLGCNLELPFNDFRKKPSGVGGVTARCKKCLNAERQGTCQDCKGSTSAKSKARCKPCMGIANRGENNPKWRGGKYLTADGYILVTGQHDHPNKDVANRVAEHVLVMSNHINRGLVKGESVHHKNGNRSDNRIENLELWSTSQPAGQRVVDKVAWAKELLRLYEPEVLNEKASTRVIPS